MENNQLQKASDLQMMPLQEAQGWYAEFVAFSKSILKEDLDYGVIPGTPKPSLYKPGAEKLRLVYGLTSEMECIERTVDLDRPFIDYTYRCTIKTKQGQILAQCEGSCNSLEPKFGYIWLSADELPAGTDTSVLKVRSSGKKLTEFDFAITKGETTGQYGKPAAYWAKWRTAIQSGTARRINKQTKGGKSMAAWELDESATQYRVLNPDVVGLKNTIMKMGQKRAFVGSILLATGASEFYTQDIEDMEINGQVYTNTPQYAAEQEVLMQDDDTEGTPVDVFGEADKAANIAGKWHAMLEKCKTLDDVDNLSLKHKQEIVDNPELRKLFTVTKSRIRLDAGNK